MCYSTLITWCGFKPKVILFELPLSSEEYRKIREKRLNYYKNQENQ